MADLIDRLALYERAATLEAQALDYVGKLIERDGDETSTEWRIWSAILTERTAFKHDVYDAPSVQPTLHGYNVKHLELIARVLQKENISPEKVTEALTDIGRIVAIIKDEFEETLRRTVQNIEWRTDE